MTVAHFLYVSHKAIATPRNSLDVLMLARPLAQHVSQRRDVSRNVSFLDRGVGPDEFHHLVFAEDVPAVLHQHEQDVEDPRPQRNNLTIAQQLALARLEAKR